MNKSDPLIKVITNAIQDKKGKKIVWADLTPITDTICDYFVVAEGSSPSQVSSVVQEVRDAVKEETGVAPESIDGLQNSEWVAMDYGHILVHVFLPEQRDFYNLETLWADAKLTPVPDLE